MFSIVLCVRVRVRVCVRVLPEALRLVQQSQRDGGQAIQRQVQPLQAPKALEEQSAGLSTVFTANQFKPHDQ